MAQIRDERLKELLEAEKLLLALQAAGVDNWEGWDDAIEIYEEKLDDAVEIYEEKP